MFCGEEGLPITEHLPEDHEGREAYGLRTDPDPEKGRALTRLEEKQGRRIAKGVRADTDEPPASGGGSNNEPRNVI